MPHTIIQRMRALHRPADEARRRIDDARRRDDDPLAFARGLMNAFALSLLIWILIALGLVWLNRM